jgi:hypothetical protein
MSMTGKIIIAALIGAGVIAGGGAFYVFVVAPPSVRRAVLPYSNGNSATNAQLDAQMKALCEASGKDAPPLCKQTLAGKSSN